MESPTNQTTKGGLMDSILHKIVMKCNRNLEINFDGGSLSSDSGLMLFMEFIKMLRLEDILIRCFTTGADTARQIHTDAENLLQHIYMVLASYFRDDDSDPLAKEPILKMCVGAKRLASQPTMSRFFSRMTEETACQFWEIMRELRKTVYKLEGIPTEILLDLDTTLMPTYGAQEGASYNHHYGSNGYHPLLCYDGFTGDLLRGWLRDGAKYCSKGAAELLKPLIRELKEDAVGVNLLARGDSGFATPELYDLFEDEGIGYIIRLKANSTLYNKAKALEKKLFKHAKHDLLSPQKVYGQFYYQADSWREPRMVKVKIEKPAGTFERQYMFIVTNMQLTAEFIVSTYCKRGNVENFIKECKEGFGMRTASSKTRAANANRMQANLMTYNIFNYFRRLALPQSMRSDRIDTVRFKLVKIASRVVSHAGKTEIRLCGHCVHKDEFIETFNNIRDLIPKAA